MKQNQKELLKPQDVCDLLRISLRQFYRINQADAFPNARVVGKTKLWIRQEIWDWLEAQVAPSSAKISTSSVYLPTPRRGRPTKSSELEKRIAGSLGGME